MNSIRKFLPIFIILALSYLIIKQLFITGFFPFHDNTQVQRVFEMKKALTDGIFPVRWVADLGYGYGYPIFNFYAPFAYYVGGFLSLIGYDALVATKIMLGLGIILSGISMYFFAKQFWGRTGGLVSGLLYLYAPYHAVDIFVRGDFAEIYAYVFIPLVFLGIYKIYLIWDNHPGQAVPIPKLQFKIKKNLFYWIILSSASFAGIILSHNLTAMMITPFIIAYALVLIIKSPKHLFLMISSYFIILILGLLLSAFYWLPALSEMKYTNVASQIGGGADFRDHFVCLGQLWDSPWGYGGSVAGCTDGISFKIGKLHLIFAAFSIFMLFFIRKKRKDLSFQILFFTVSLIVTVYFMLDISRPVWEIIPQMSYIQYPWRFLILASFAAS